MISYFSRLLSKSSAPYPSEDTSAEDERIIALDQEELAGAFSQSIQQDVEAELEKKPSPKVTEVQKTEPWSEFAEEDLDWIQEHWKAGAAALNLGLSTRSAGNEREYDEDAEILQLIKSQWPEGARALNL